jgi:HEPN domain-containing protein
MWRDLLDDAEREMKRAMERLDQGDYEYACFHAQQCGEMALKALLRRFANYMYEHNLVALYERVKQRHGLDLKLDMGALAELTKHCVTARYRGARAAHGITYDRGLAERCVEISRGVLDAVRRALEG